MKEQIRTERAPAPSGAYSQAIRVGEFIFLAGQGPYLPSGELVSGTFEDQARQTFENVAAVAEASGSSLSDAVRVGAFLRNMENFETMNKVYLEYFDEPLPARTTAQSNLRGIEIEVDAILWHEGD